MTASCRTRVRVRCDLYGSLGATGKGHGSDKAVLLGLAGHEPDTVDVEAIPALLKADRATAARCRWPAVQPMHFDERRDLLFHRRESLPLHANGMRFAAFDASGARARATAMYYSVGGGFVISDEVAADGSRLKAHRAGHHGAAAALPQRLRTCSHIAQREGCSIAEVMRAQRARTGAATPRSTPGC